MKHHSGIYRNEVEKPELPSEGHMEHGYGCHEFKNEADSISAGQAGEEGIRKDEGRISSQKKDYHWD